MPFPKIDLHEVDINLKQAKESTDLVRSLQEELENVLARYDDNGKRYAAGELSKEEFADITRSKDEAVASINAKVKNNIWVIASSLDTIRKIAIVQEPTDESAERAVVRKSSQIKPKAKPHRAAPKRHAAKKKGKRK